MLLLFEYTIFCKREREQSQRWGEGRTNFADTRKNHMAFVKWSKNVDYARWECGAELDRGKKEESCGGGWNKNETLSFLVDS